MSEIEGWWSLGDRAAVQREWSQLASNSIAIRRQHRGVVHFCARRGELGRGTLEALYRRMIVSGTRLMVSRAECEQLSEAVVLYACCRVSGYKLLRRLRSLADATLKVLENPLYLFEFNLFTLGGRM